MPRKSKRSAASNVDNSPNKEQTPNKKKKKIDVDETSTKKDTVKLSIEHWYNNVYLICLAVQAYSIGRYDL